MEIIDGMTAPITPWLVSMDLPFEQLVREMETAIARSTYAATADKSNEKGFYYKIIRRGVNDNVLFDMFILNDGGIGGLRINHGTSRNTYVHVWNNLLIYLPEKMRKHIVLATQEMPSWTATAADILDQRDNVLRRERLEAEEKSEREGLQAEAKAEVGLAAKLRLQQQPNKGGRPPRVANEVARLMHTSGRFQRIVIRTIWEQIYRAEDEAAFLKLADVDRSFAVALSEGKETPGNPRKPQET